MHSVKLVIDLQTAIIIMYALVMHPSIVVLTEGITTATFNWRASNNTKHHCSSIHTNRWKQAMYYLTTCQFQDLSRDWPFPWYMIQNIDSQYCLHKTASHSIRHSSLPCSFYGALRLSFDTAVIWPPATSLASWNKSCLKLYTICKRMDWCPLAIFASFRRSSNALYSCSWEISGLNSSFYWGQRHQPQYYY